MNPNDLLAQIGAMSSSGIGAFFLKLGEFWYQMMYPSNAPAAQTVTLDAKEAVAAKH